MEPLITAAKFLFDNKKFSKSAKLLETCFEFTEDKKILNDIHSNARMCYFLANDVPNALRILESQEALGVNKEWEIIRDKANFLRYLNRHDEAYELTFQIPDEKTKYLAMGWFLHKQGKIKEAFDITEKSRSIGGYWWKSSPSSNYKIWTGEKVKNLIVCAESGYGDQIIFSRWIPQLKQFCDNLYYDGDDHINSVFWRNYNILSTENKTIEDAYVVPIMSLPYLLKIDEPSAEKYLFSKERLKDNYDQNFTKTRPIRIGICTHGDKNHIETTLRSFSLKKTVDQLEDLGEIINLDKEIYEKDSRVRYIPFEIWEDTLALIDTCDVVISCDTSISHAAAALGKPTIVLMHAAAYFTWNHNEDMAKTIWYKNAWCIHQDKPCEWDGSIEKTRKLVKNLLLI
jgi:tetratricopeptide (TPR) repeat protein